MAGPQNFFVHIKLKYDNSVVPMEEGLEKCVMGDKYNSAERGKPVEKTMWQIMRDAAGSGAEVSWRRGQEPTFEERFVKLLCYMEQRNHHRGYPECRLVYKLACGLEKRSIDHQLLRMFA